MTAMQQRRRFVVDSPARTSAAAETLRHNHLLHEDDT
jgi:hypothetical protein